jgi:hypothetical protein
MFLKDNIDYYDDFLVEDKIQDLQTAKENVSNQNKVVRPTKPSAKTSFKPREKKITSEPKVYYVNNNLSSNQNHNNSSGVNNSINTSHQQGGGYGNNNGQQRGSNLYDKLGGGFKENKENFNPNKEGLSGKNILYFFYLILLF